MYVFSLFRYFVIYLGTKVDSHLLWLVELSIISFYFYATLPTDLLFYYQKVPFSKTWGVNIIFIYTYVTLIIIGQRSEWL